MTVVASFVCILVVVAGLIVADDAAARSATLESVGLFRGAILDDMGRPLVTTELRRSRASRVYHAADLAAITGYRDPAGRWHGLEALYDTFLSARRARHDWRSYFLHLRGQVAAGGNLQLTIDRGLQSVATRALGAGIGAVVALDPRTGDVKAMVSSPSCSPTLLSQPAGYQRCHTVGGGTVNRALQHPVPPGSSFKIVTLTAALDTHRFALNSVFAGADVFGPSPYFDNVLYPSNITRSDITTLTLAQALAFSDNFTFAHVGLTLGAPTLLRYAHRYYVGMHIPFVYPVAPSIVADGSPRPSTSQLAQSSFGAAVDRVTPLQMALIAATVANGGVMPAPRLVAGLIPAGSHRLVATPTRMLDRVMSAATARAVTRGMNFVVNHGSGYRAQIGGVGVAGKTGTAASGAEKPNAWFIAFAPIQHPVVAVAVLHQFTGEGFEYAAPIARKVMVAALREHGYNVK